MTRFQTLLLCNALALCVGLSSQGALAGCFESGVGCTNDHAIPKSVLGKLSCEALWTVRNTIYNERGYCFTTRRAKEVFSNDDCSITDANALALNNFERTNISRIVQVEKQKGCR